MSDEFWRNLPLSLTALGTLLSVLIGIINNIRLTSVRDELNGHMTQLLSVEKQVSFTKGGDAERAKADTRIAALAEGEAQARADAAGERIADAAETIAAVASGPERRKKGPGDA